MNPPRDIPIVSFVGKSRSGKTTFLEALIAALSARGWKVATVKHHAHTTELDTPGKDSWRHARAGAWATMVSSPAQFALITRTVRELTLSEIARVAADAGCDLLIAEGYKRAGVNRIEVVRAERSRETVCGPGEVIALVTDVEGLSAGEAPVFDLADAAAVADFIEARFLRARGSLEAEARAAEVVPDGD